MASSGSFNTTGYQGRYLKFTWSVSSQSIANNSTTIQWSLTGAGNAQSTWYKAGNFKVIIDGSTVYNSETRINLYNGTVVANGTYTLVHDSQGNKSFTASAQAGIYTVAVNCTGSGSFTLPQIARAAKITAAPNFNDEENPTITYNNPAGSAVTSLQACISLTGSTDDVPYREISKTGTSYTFELTTAERTTLRNAAANTSSISVKFYLKTTVGGQTFWESVTRTMTIINASPVFSTPTYEDINAVTIAITGNNQKIIQNNSTLQINVPTATARKSATITKYEVTINAETRETTAGALNWGTVDVSQNVPATLRVTDSRGKVAQQTITIQIEPWSLPYAVISLRRQNNFYTETILNVNPTISSLSGQNSATIQYRYKKTTDSSYSAWTTAAANTNITVNLDNAYDWDFKVNVADRIGSVTYNLTVPKGTPIIFFDRLKGSTGFNCFPENNNSVESNGLVLDDVIYIGSQQLYDRYDFTAAGTVTLLGAYDYRLIDGIFNGFTIPTGYEKAYRLTAQVTTNNGNTVGASIGIMSCAGGTWSGVTFRIPISSAIVKQSEFTLEQTFNYTKNGLNLKVTNSGSYTGSIYAITVHGYIVKSSTAFPAVANYIATEEAT